MAGSSYAMDVTDITTVVKGPLHVNLHATILLMPLIGSEQDDWTVIDHIPGHRYLLRTSS